MYRHTQRGWVVLTVCSLVTAIMGASSLSRERPLRPVAVLGLAALPLLVMLLFHSLTVTVDDEWIDIRFGPGLIRKRVRLADVVDCRPFRYPWWWGWGIRGMGWGGGWLYNVSGLDAVRLTLMDGGRIGIGTDEPQALCDAIQSRPRN